MTGVSTVPGKRAPASVLSTLDECNSIFKGLPPKSMALLSHNESSLTPGRSIISAQFSGFYGGSLSVTGEILKSCFYKAANISVTS